MQKGKSKHTQNQSKKVSVYEEEEMFMQERIKRETSEFCSSLSDDLLLTASSSSLQTLEFKNV